jgi:hypothetical protein
MRVFICASRSNYHRVPSIQRELERRDHVVTLPNNYDDPAREERIKSSTPTEYRRWKARMLGVQREKVQANDAVLVLNFDKGESRNYLGGATFLEVFKAWELGRRIFFLNPLPDGILRDELDAMSPVVIDGDLSLVS